MGIIMYIVMIDFFLSCPTLFVVSGNKNKSENESEETEIQFPFDTKSMSSRHLMTFRNLQSHSKDSFLSNSQLVIQFQCPL